MADTLSVSVITDPRVYQGQSRPRFARYINGLGPLRRTTKLQTLVEWSTLLTNVKILDSSGPRKTLAPWEIPPVEYTHYTVLPE